MKLCCVFFAITIVACGGGGKGVTRVDGGGDQGANSLTDGSSFDLTAITCSRSCACNADADALCIGSSETSPYAATCLPECDVGQPCGTGARCVFLLNEPTATIPVCIPANFPDTCAGTSAQICDSVMPHCIGAATLIRPYHSADARVCGSEIVECTTTCVDESATDADGGMPDGGIAAHCE